MAIYHCSIQTISRSQGRSATSASAYRSGTEIVDHRTGEIHDYTRKDGVIHAGIVLPKNAPEEYKNRSDLWNAAEKSEKRVNSVVAREVRVGIPYELNDKAKHELIKNYSQYLSDRYKTGVDYAIHKADKGGDLRNDHAHILMTTRRIGKDGFGEKTRELDAYKSSGKLEINNIRQTWEEHTNRALEKAGKSERIDSRSLKDQGIDREPTKHVGVAGTAIDRKGQFSERAEINREIRKLNNERINTLKELKELHGERQKIQSEISKLKVSDKESFRELKGNQRIEKAVDSAKFKASEIHKEREAKADKFHLGKIDKSEKRVDNAQKNLDSLESKAAWTKKGLNKNKAQVKGAKTILGNAEKWHQETVDKNATPQGRVRAAIEKGEKDIAKVDKAEPKKRFWSSQEKHDKKHEEWRGVKDDQVKKVEANIERSAPTLDKSIDIASGKSAFENKVAKTTIKERFNSNNKAITEHSSEKNADIKAKLKTKTDQVKGVKSDVSDRQARLERIKTKLKQAESKRDANSKEIVSTKTEINSFNGDKGDVMKKVVDKDMEEAKANERRVNRVRNVERKEAAIRAEKGDGRSTGEPTKSDNRAKIKEKAQQQGSKQADQGKDSAEPKQADSRAKIKEKSQEQKEKPKDKGQELGK
jgi:hypothetical protein